MLSESRIEPLARLLSLAGALIVVTQVLEMWAVGGVLVAKTPAEWRVGLLGVLAGRIPLLVLADLVLYAGIVYQGSRAALRWMGWSHLVITAGLGFILLILASSVLTLLRAGVTRLALVTALRAAITFGLTALLTFLAGWLSVRNARRPKWVGRKRPKTPLLTDTD